jgi:hypothetical protein
MPAPTKEQLQVAIETAFISNGLTKKEIDSNGNIIDTHQLSDDQRKLINSIAEGIAAQWAVWQNSQTVLVPGIQLGISSVIGKLP